MSTSASTLISQALQTLGILRKGESPSSDESSDAFNRLNDLIAGWANDDLLVSARTLENFTLTIAKGTYTIGSGGDFNTVRPISILEAYVRQNNIDFPIQIISDDSFQMEIMNKSVQSPLPSFLNCDNAYPLGTISLWPVPNVGNALYLLSEKSLTAFSSLSSTVDLPPGWARALRYNLAVEIAPEYDKEPSGVVVELARQSKADIRRAILRNRPVEFSAVVGRVYNILGDI